MHPTLATPWFDSAIARLEVRKGNRVLALGSQRDEARAIHSVVGKAGQLTLVLDERLLAEDLAERGWPGVRVLLHDIDGRETFGTFDSLLVVPSTGPLLMPTDYAELARNNLRPGGRFVVDTPGTEMVPDLFSAWRTLGWDEERLNALRGPDDVELSDALREAGLRGVESALGSHLLHVAAGAELVAAFADVLALDEQEETELAHAVVSHRKDAGPLDVLVHRTQVAGQR